MVLKEVKGMMRNFAYLSIMVLPLLLTFIMASGTKNYLVDVSGLKESGNVLSNVRLYQGTLLDSKAQFAVSELSFMVMMVSNLIGLNVFEERDKHVWDRVVCKNKFIGMKFFVHIGFSILMILINVVCYKYLFDVSIPLSAILVFLSITLICLPFGILVGMYVKSRAMVSNIILMIVMLMGYFGGALSLTSVLATTKYMHVFRYLSPLTLANQLIYKLMLQIDMRFELLVYSLLLVVFGIAMFVAIRRRIKDGAVL